jgi:protein-disulfide isomerase
MQSTRRNALIIGGAVVVVGAAGGGYAWFANRLSASPLPAGLLPAATPAPTPPSDPRMADRALGEPTAPVTVSEWFSLTCPHCARFEQETLPQIRADLIATGKLRYVFKDFPLDQVALMAAMVARSLPPERYDPFCAALLASQDRWAFARGINSTDEIFKFAALAGMSREQYDAAINDQALKAAIIQEQDVGAKILHVDSTPSFIFNGPGAKDHRESGEMSFADFAKQVASAAGA